MVRWKHNPFAGIRVVEFGQFVAVPFCAQLLAEGGAEVVKIEALAGDPTRLLRQIAPLETRTYISEIAASVRCLWPCATPTPSGDRAAAQLGGCGVDELSPWPRGRDRLG